MQSVDATLRKELWFEAGKWKTLVQLWPSPEAPTCAMLQLYKDGWHNEDTCGVHIETWLLDGPVENQKVPVLMHVLHRKTFPGGQNADALSKPLLEDAEVQKLVKSWRGYKAGKGGMTPFRANKALKEDSVVQDLVTELNKVQAIGMYVDRYLAAI